MVTSEVLPSTKFLLLRNLQQNRLRSMETLVSVEVLRNQVEGRSSRLALSWGTTEIFCVRMFGAWLGRSASAGAY